MILIYYSKSSCAHVVLITSDVYKVYIFRVPLTEKLTTLVATVFPIAQIYIPLSTALVRKQSGSDKSMSGLGPTLLFLGEMGHR